MHDEDDVGKADQADSSVSLFDPAWNGEAAVTQAEAARWLAPGGTLAVLGTYQMKARKRLCNAVSGCGSWQAISSNWANSGRMELRVAGGSLDLELVGDRCTYWGNGANPPALFYGMSCRGVGKASLTCGGYQYVYTRQWGGSGGTFCDTAFAEVIDQSYESVKLRFSGKLSQHRLWLKAEGTSAAAGKPNWTEAEAVVAAPIRALAGEGDWWIDPIGGAAFLLARQPASWETARAACQSLGGDLGARPDGGMNKGRSSPVTERFWVGARRDKPHGTFRWVHHGDQRWLGLPQNGGQGWWRGEPNDANGGEECVETIPWAITALNGQVVDYWYKFNDNNCATPMSFLCVVD